MKIPYAVRRGKTRFFAWTPFDTHATGFGSSKIEAVADLRKRLQEDLIKVDGEIGEMEL